MTTEQFGTLLILAGGCVLVFKGWIARKGAGIYSRLGFEVTEAQYAKQIQIVAIALIVLGMIALF